MCIDLAALAKAVKGAAQSILGPGSLYLVQFHVLRAPTIKDVT